jgi:hypothetical protein
MKTKYLVILMLFICFSNEFLRSGLRYYKENNEISQQWNDYFNNKFSILNNLQDSLKNNCFSFGFITDLHNEYNYKKSAIYMSKIIDYYNIKYFLNGGDFFTNQLTSNDAKLQLNDIINRYYNVGILNKMLPCMGNHDFNTDAIGNGSDEFSVRALTNSDIYDSLFKHCENMPNVHISPPKMYYYVDDSLNKVRYITLNCMDFDPDKMHAYIWGYSQEQLNWLTSSLLLKEVGWGVVIQSHIPPMNIFDQFPLWKPYNNNLVLGVLDAFIHKKAYSGSNNYDYDHFDASVSADFSSSDGVIYCWLSGHSHRDWIGVLQNKECSGLPIIITNTDSYVWTNSSYPEYNSSEKIENTITEQLFDIVTVDKNNEMVYVTRIGATSKVYGEQRNVSYKQVIDSNNIIERNDIVVYSNSSDKLNINFNNDSYLDSKITIFDILGRKITEMVVKNKVINIDLGNKCSKLIFIHIVDQSKNVYSYKIILS